MNRWGVPVGVGTKFLYDGEYTTIVETHSTGTSVEVVTLDVRRQTIRRFTLNELMFSDRVQMISTQPGPATDDLDDVASVVLSAVDERIRTRAFDRAAHIREVLSGYRSGSAETALPGEPRPQYSPRLPKMQRYQAKCDELTISLSTLQNWVTRFKEHGTAGLVAQREVRPGIGSRTDPRFIETAGEVMAEYLNESMPSKRLVYVTTAARLEARYGAGAVKLPCESTADLILTDLERQHPLWSHSTKRNRDIADRPKGVYGKLQPTRPGEYLLMDTTRSDVYAMDPHTLSWLNCEITVVMDWFTRLIVGLRVTPMSTKSIDGACTLYQAIRPPPAGTDWPAHAVWPPVGVPRHVLVEVEALDPESACGRASPTMVPDTVVVDHGSIFISEHLTSVCQRLGISIQPAHLRTGRDKGPVERFFLTLREGLLQWLPGYKGPDLNSRGLTPELDSWLYVDQLEECVRGWIAEIYHNTEHSGLRGLELGRLQLTPAEKWAEGIARGGYLEMPRDPYLPLEFLPVEWRTIQPKGIRWENRFYQHEVLARHVGQKSPYLHRDGKWPIHYNPDDITTVYMRDPDGGRWIPLDWEDKAAVAFPMSQDVMKFERVLACTEGRFLNGPLAIMNFLKRHDLDLANSTKDRRIALRMAREQSTLIGDIQAAMARPEGFDDDGDGGRHALTAGPRPTELRDERLVDGLDEVEPEDDTFIDDDAEGPDDGDFYAATLEVL